MKSIIIFYSLEGNCKLLCEKLSQACGCELLQIKPVKEYPTGVLKFPVGGKAAVRKEKPKLMPYSFDASAYDIIVLASPVWASTMTPPVLTFLTDNNLQGKDVALIATQTGKGADKMFENMKEIISESKVVSTFTAFDPKTKDTEAQLEKAVAWMKNLLEEK